MIDSRVKRFVVGLILFIALACLGAVAALFVWVNEKAVQKTVEEFADTALGAYARFDGPIGLKRLSTLEIELPAIKFIDKSTDVEIGRIAGARADVSLWSLALGAVHVKSLSIDGLEGALSVPNLSGNALFDSTFGAVHFPADLRISTFKLSRACLTVDVTTHEKPHRFLLTDLELSLGRFSPEMTSPFELSTRFEAIDAEGNVVSLPQDEPLPVAAPAELPSANSADVSVDLSNNAASSETAADANAAPAVDEPKEALPTDPAQNAPAVDAAGSAPADSPTQEAPAEVKPVEETSAGTPPADEGVSENNAAAPQSTQTSPADAAQQSAAPTAEAPGEAAAETHNEEAAAAPSSNDQRAIERREEAPLEAPAEPPAQSSALSGLIFSEAHAEPAATQNASHAADSIFTTFDPSKSAGLLSSTGTITISTANRYVMFENLNFSGEFFYNKTHYTAVAKADVIRFKGEELSGMNATASLSRPQEVSGDLHFGAVDFRLRPGIFESPEMRVAHSFMEDGRTTSFEISSTVRADLVEKKTNLESFSARVTVTGDKTLPSDFAASLSGFVHADLGSRAAEVGLSGSFAGAPISYNGTIDVSEGMPRLRGDLMVGEINTAALPAVKNLDWLQLIDFAGTLRIGSIVSGPFSATQLHAQLSAGEGLMHLDDLIVNTADGRIIGKAKIDAAGAWNFEGRLDGISTDKLLAGFGTAPLVSGAASGELFVSGNRLDKAALKASSRLRVLRGAYHGIDADAARRVVMGTGEQTGITRKGAKSPFDEASALVHIEKEQLKISNIVARSVYLKSTGAWQVNLASGEVSAAVKNVFSPMHGVPSIYLTATVSGAASAPVWTFDWAQASGALSRAQGRPMLGAPKSEAKDAPHEESRSIWQSVRDFFKF